MKIKNDSYLGVNWDFNDDLLRFKTDKNVTIIWDKKSIINYLHNNPQKFHHFIFACWSNCSNGEKELKNKIIATFKISYSDPRGRAYLINLDEKSINSINMNSQLIKSEDTLQNKTPLYIDVYRKIRDFLHLEQI
ncbi:MAG: hypothetical protein M1479_07885 [Actinobacteria bacterium]|nr:hypothetical protein [Actinomycetota bacterium]